MEWRRSYWGGKAFKCINIIFLHQQKYNKTYSIDDDVLLLCVYATSVNISFDMGCRGLHTGLRCHGMIGDGARLIKLRVSIGFSRCQLETVLFRSNSLGSANLTRYGYLLYLFVPVSG